MKNKNLISLVLTLFLILFYSSISRAENTEMCGNSVTEYIYQNHNSNHFEYLESRNDAGIFFDYAWNKTENKVIIKRDKNNYPIVRFSFFENSKIKAGETSIKKIGTKNLSKLNDNEIINISKNKGDIKIELSNGEKLEIVSKKYNFNDFKLSDFEIVSIQKIDNANGILEMSFVSKFTNIRNDILKVLTSDKKNLNNLSLAEICDDFRSTFFWPLSSVEFDEFKYDADVREGLKNKEILVNPVFQLTYDNGEIRTIRTEKGVGFFRQSFDFRKFPFDTQKLIISIGTGEGNFENVTFITPEAGAFIGVEKFINPEVNKLKSWEIKDIEIKNRFLNDEKWDIYNNEIYDRSENFLDIIITIERNYQHYLLKIMLPVFLILCVAWYVLWIPTHKYEARLNTSIIALLALIAYNFVFQDDIPKLDYLTDLDWFILLSYIFCCIPVFLSIGFSRFVSPDQKFVTKINRLIKIWGGILYCLISLQIFFYK